MFVGTAMIEFAYLYLRWRQFGARRVVLGVLLANVASHALLIPVMYLTEEIWF